MGSINDLKAQRNFHQAAEVEVVAEVVAEVVTKVVVEVVTKVVVEVVAKVVVEVVAKMVPVAEVLKEPEKAVVSDKTVQREAFTIVVKFF